MRLGVVLRYVGIIMLVVALFMLLSAGVSLVSHTDSGYYPLLLSALLTALLGAFPLIFVDRTEQLSSKEGYCIVVGSWIVASVVGMFPYLMWGGEFSLVNAWFESVSGYTTTGASILKDVEALPRGLLFWRSCSTWLGGVGVVMFALLILPSLGTNKALLTNVELSSMAKHNYHYKASMIAQILLFIYLGLTFCSTLALKLAGMNWFDALTQAIAHEPARMEAYSKRGPKYLDTLQFERALADYTHCEQADGMSVESRYRIGMAQYMLQNYDAATAAFAGSLAIVPQDDDMYIADVYWLVLSQLRAGKADEAQKTLKQHYRPDMYVGHHTAYEKAMRVAAGFAPMEDMLAELDTEPDDLQFAMTAYGLCVLLETHGETEKADALREKLLKRDGFWFCFSYLAAYSDRKYTVKPAAVT